MTSLDKEGLVKVSGTQWKPFMLPQRKFEDLSPRSFKRKTIDKNIYEIYSDKEHFETIESESVLSSINEGKVRSPYKIVNVNCRIPDIVHAGQLELIHTEAETNQESEEIHPKDVSADAAAVQRTLDELQVQTPPVQTEVTQPLTGGE